MALEQFQQIISTYSRLYNVPESWIKAIIMTESSGRPDAYRAEPQINDGSYGLMQLLTKTAKGLGYTGTPDGLFDPATNINLGTKLLAELRSRFGDDFRRIYSAYNSGKPDLYLSSTQVARNVSRAVEFLEKFIKEEPLVIATGASSGLLIIILLWIWTKKGHK